MPRPRNKEDLIIAATTNYEKLLTLIESRTESEKSSCYDFSADEKKKEAASETILSVPRAVTMTGL